MDGAGTHDTDRNGNGTGDDGAHVPDAPGGARLVGRKTVLRAALAATAAIPLALAGAPRSPAPWPRAARSPSSRRRATTETTPPRSRSRARTSSPTRLSAPASWSPECPAPGSP